MCFRTFPHSQRKRVRQETKLEETFHKTCCDDRGGKHLTLVSLLPRRYVPHTEEAIVMPGDRQSVRHGHAGPQLAHCLFGGATVCHSGATRPGLGDDV